MNVLFIYIECEFYEFWFILNVWLILDLLIFYIYVILGLLDEEEEGEDEEEKEKKKKKE